MSEEIKEIIKGRLSKEGVIISDPHSIVELQKRGYGELEGEKLVLRDYEALYLLYTNRLKVLSDDKELNLDDLASFALKKDPQAWTRFLIYRNLRSRGYVAKEGFGFGVDFRLYDRGDFGSKPAKYVVFGLNEGTELPLSKLKSFIDQMNRMGKEAIIAVIERRGEVIYYRVSRTKFKEL